MDTDPLKAIAAWRANDQSALDLSRVLRLPSVRNAIALSLQRMQPDGSSNTEAGLAAARYHQLAGANEFLRLLHQLARPAAEEGTLPEIPGAALLAGAEWEHVTGSLKDLFPSSP